MYFKSSRIFFSILSVLLVQTVFCALVRSTNEDIEVELTTTTDGITLTAKKGTDIKISATIGKGVDYSSTTCVGQKKCTIGDTTLAVTSVKDGIRIIWETFNVNTVFKDCFDLKSNEMNWYGGPERKEQNWPLEKMIIYGNESYIIKQTDNFSVAERYWLNSKGAYIYIDRRAPLFVSQNDELNDAVCFIAKIENEYIYRSRNILNYTIILQDDPKKGQMHAVKNFLGKPTGYPNENMIREPIWTTWAKYKTPINDSIVLSFAQDIRDNGFTKGQLEIDDDWETCYGSQIFDPSADKFPKITETVKKLKEMDFRVTLWVHPFVDSDCEENASVGQEKGYFVKTADGRTNSTWWNSNDSKQIDYTNPEAVTWHSARLNKILVDHGIDSLKLDAGEANYGPQPAVFGDNVDPELVPNILTEKYLRMCAEFGDLIEVRSAFRTQDLPMFVRMVDKDSTWGVSNGLYTLITTLFQMNLNGYPMVLPDMIGGNEYFGQVANAELLIRWTQANVFMPAMQFSIPPWDVLPSEYDSVAVVKKFVDLHEQYSDLIIEAMKKAVEDGTPVNTPIWWIDPTDSTALKNDDEYLLGEEILVAPVIIEGATSRNIYLPKGSWKDGNDGTIYEGPITLENYPAPLEVLPYFIRQK